MSKTSATIREIVLARLLTMPDNIGVSMGSDGKFSKNDLIEHVQKDDEIGKKIIQIHISYLQSMKNLTNILIE